MKLYIVQKYIWARSAEHALQVERGVKPDEVFIDSKWRENQDKTPDAIGYKPKKKRA